MTLTETFKLTGLHSSISFDESRKYFYPAKRQPARRLKEEEKNHRAGPV